MLLSGSIRKGAGTRVLGEVLKARRAKYESLRNKRSESDDTQISLTAKGASNNDTRSITRLEQATAVDDELYANRDIYQRRQAIVEAYEGGLPIRGVNTLNDNGLPTTILLRSLEKVDGEYSLLACWDNIRRSMFILGYWTCLSG